MHFHLFVIIVFYVSKVSLSLHFSYARICLVTARDSDTIIRYGIQTKLNSVTAQRQFSVHCVACDV